MMAATWRRVGSRPGGFLQYWHPRQPFVVLSAKSVLLEMVAGGAASHVAAPCFAASVLARLVARSVGAGVQCA